MMTGNINGIETKEFIKKCLGMGCFATSQTEVGVFKRVIELKMQGYPLWQAPKIIGEEFGPGWAGIVEEFVVQCREKQAA